MSSLTKDTSPDCRFFVAHESDVPHVTTGAQVFCMRNGLGHLVAAHVATAASELANNLWMHACHGGYISLRYCEEGTRRGVEVLSEDDGPGIADLTLALSEGWSSAGGMGCGLSGVQRLMDGFEIDSAVGRGTTVRVRKWAPVLAAMPSLRRPDLFRSPDGWGRNALVRSVGGAPASLRLDVAMLCSPAEGEVACGDACVSLPVPACGGHWLAVVDGLGHGTPAAVAAQRALQEIACQAQAMAGDPAGLLSHLDEALRPTRGAAVGLVWFDGSSLSFAGVGNTRVLRWRQGRTTRLTSVHGIVGEGRVSSRAWPSPQERLSLLPDDWVVMFSDGLDEMMQWDATLPAWQSQPASLARHLLGRWRQVRDDAAVLVAKVSWEVR
jgi:serine/threonine-protein kinase RsbT